MICFNNNVITKVSNGIYHLVHRLNQNKQSKSRPKRDAKLMLL